MRLISSTPQTSAPPAFSLVLPFASYMLVEHGDDYAVEGHSP